MWNVPSNHAAISVDQAGCSIEDYSGHTLRKAKVTATGGKVMERITSNEEVWRSPPTSVTPAAG